MNTELRRKMATARKQHRCSLCTGYIEQGDKYERATLVYDSQIGDFLTCENCLDDSILEQVYTYWGDEGGVNDEDAYEWALDCTLYPYGIPADELDAAKRLIDRHLAAIQPVRNPSTFGGAA